MKVTAEHLLAINQRLHRKGALSDFEEWEFILGLGQLMGKQRYITDWGHWKHVAQYTPGVTHIISTLPDFELRKYFVPEGPFVFSTASTAEYTCVIENFSDANDVSG